MKLTFKSDNFEKRIDLNELNISLGKENEEKILNMLKDISNSNSFDHLANGTFVIEQIFLFGYPVIIKGDKK